MNLLLTTLPVERWGYDVTWQSVTASRDVTGPRSRQGHRSAKVTAWESDLDISTECLSSRDRVTSGFISLPNTSGYLVCCSRLSSSHLSLYHSIQRSRLFTLFVSGLKDGNFRAPGIGFTSRESSWSCSIVHRVLMEIMKRKTLTKCIMYI